MSGWPKIEATTGPFDAAEVLFDFSSPAGGSRPVRHDGFTLGAPEPQGAGWSLRQVVIPTQVAASRAAALARHAEMSRVLLRRRFWLRVQWDALQAPVWFRVIDVDPAEVTFDKVMVELPDLDAWESSATLTCEPFAYGERITLGTYTIANDPEAAENPMRVVLDDVVGDAPAPLRMDVTSGAWNGQRWLWTSAPHPGDAPAATVLDVGIGDTWTGINDTDAGATDTSAAGGSWREVTFATEAGLATRLTGSVTLPHGQYLVAVRVDYDGTALERYELSLTANINVGVTPLTPVQTSIIPIAGTAREWIVLGELRTMPNIPDVPPDLTLPLAQTSVLIRAGKVDPPWSGSMRLDSVMFIPVGDLVGDWRATTLRTHVGEDDTAPERVLWDGDTETAIPSHVSPDAASRVRLTHDGAWPTVTPGASNVLTVLPNANVDARGSDNVLDSIYDPVTVELSYQPRWLHLAASS